MPLLTLSPLPGMPVPPSGTPVAPLPLLHCVHHPHDDLLNIHLETAHKERDHICLVWTWRGAVLIGVGMKEEGQNPN